MKIVEYQIVDTRKFKNGNYNHIKIENLVNDFISQGWQPFGGIAVDREVYYQTMVKYEDQEEIEVVDLPQPDPVYL